MSTNLYISGATGGGGTGDMLKSVYDPQDTGIVLSASKEMVSVINKTGALVPKGTIVYLKTSSSSGTHPELLLASALNEATSSKTIGAVYEDIPNNNVGYAVTSGEVDNLNTNAYPIGTRLWLSTTPGQVTSTVPVQPSHAVFIGIVTRSQNTNGRILYAIQNGYELGELHDVLLSSPANNDVLTFELSTGLWKNKPASGGGGGSIIKLASQTLLATNWVIDGSLYSYTFSNASISVNTRVDFTPDNSAYLEVTTCGMLPEVDVAAGSCKFYSMFPPQNNILGEITIFPTV
jgi:hypothetical protein